MIDRRTFAKLAGATAIGSLAAPALISRSSGQGAAAPMARGNYRPGLWIVNANQQSSSVDLGGDLCHRSHERVCARPVLYVVGCSSLGPRTRPEIWRPTTFVNDQYPTLKRHEAAFYGT